MKLMFCHSVVQKELFLMMMPYIIMRYIRFGNGKWVFINDNLNMYINDHLRMYTSDYALI